MDDKNSLIGYDILTVSETMQRIDANNEGILFIINDNLSLIGCITDGDIRRFLLAGGKMDASVKDALNDNPKYAKSLNEAKSLYHSRYYVYIPIVDEQKRILSLYSGNKIEEKKHNPLNVPVVINAGGKGTRLEPFTKVLPKPLIPIGDLPIIEHIIKEFQSYSCDEFHIIVNYKKDLIKAYFADNSNNYNIAWYDEKKPLGTGGGISFLRNKFNSSFFFVNCDVLLTTNYESILNFHKDNNNTITMVCAYKNINIPYGVVEMGKNGTIENIKEKPLLSFLTNTGIYIVEPEVIDDIDDDTPIDFPEIVEIERKKGKRVAVFPVSENDWMDMGQLPELEKMRVKLSDSL